MTGHKILLLFTKNLSIFLQAQLYPVTIPIPRTLSQLHFRMVRRNSQPRGIWGEGQGLVLIFAASMKDMGTGMCAVTKMQASPETIMGCCNYDSPPSQTAATGRWWISPFPRPLLFIVERIRKSYTRYWGIEENAVDTCRFSEKTIWINQIFPIFASYCRWRQYRHNKTGVYLTLCSWPIGIWQF